MNKSFKQLCEIKAGEFLWDNNQRGSHYILVESDPVVKTVGDKTTVVFFAVVISPLTRIVSMDRYMAMDNMMHYAPKIGETCLYSHPAKKKLYNEEILKPLLLENINAKYTGQY
ncbi:hypothetical protein GD1_70 [Paraglaciecola Antarctic GD virus 1]|nr:hypothetical protein GD1_70 [Paraglaciecola Antarctic GD virus 1]